MREIRTAGFIRIILPHLNWDRCLIGARRQVGCTMDICLGTILNGRESCASVMLDYSIYTLSVVAVDFHPIRHMLCADLPIFIYRFTFQGAIAKWLRRQIRNLFPFGSAGSNPAGVGCLLLCFWCKPGIIRKSKTMINKGRPLDQQSLSFATPTEK